MLIGREYRKALAQLWALVAFRWLALWLIIAFCASKGQIGIAAGLVVVAVDVVSNCNTKGTLLALSEQSKKDWMDRLTNRMFYKILVEEMRAGHGSHVDVDELFVRASKDAVADMKRADDDSKAAAGFLDATGWHVFGAVLSFVWTWVSSALYYGSALYVGSTL